MKINKMKNGKYEFYFSTGRRVPQKNDPTKTKALVIHRSGFLTKVEATEAYLEERRNIKSGIIDSRVTFANFVESWFPMFARNNTQGQALASRTKLNYEANIRKYLVPFFGNKKIKDITRFDVRLFIDQQDQTGLSKQTIKHQYRLLSLIIDGAVEQGLTAKNFVKEVKPPQPRKKTKAEKEEQYLDHQQQKDLLKTVEWELQKDDHYTKARFLMVHIGMSLGLRLSEVLALKWIDLVATTQKRNDKFVYILKVQRALDEKGNDKDTKRYKSERDMPLDQSLLKLLLEHKAYMDQCKEGKENWNLNNRIFTNPQGESLYGRKISQMMRSLFDRAGLNAPLSFHSLRHTCISNWLHDVPNVKLISSLAGHSNIGITLDLYGHVIEANAISEIDNLFATMRSLR